MIYLLSTYLAGFTPTGDELHQRHLQSCPLGQTFRFLSSDVTEYAWPEAVS
jgi:hypothetical protein